MKKDIADIAIIIVAVIILFILPFVFGSNDNTAPTPPPIQEQEDEPAIPTPTINTLLAATNTTALPKGVICLDDCPLIEVPPGEVEAQVRAYFNDIPVMVAIAKCESQYRQHKYIGVVLKNEQGSSATGVMQIMASIHEAEAVRLGENIQTTQGNMAYARVLYNQSGTTPWNASISCWGSDNMAINNVITDKT